ncbi:MAG: C4-type zinc ribbon domain-containing protein [bacterium]
MAELSRLLAELYELQIIDNEIIDKVRSIRQIERDEDPIQKKYRELTSRLESFSGEQTPFKDKAKELQDQIALLKDKKKAVEDKLFSPNTDPKDLQYLQKEREQHNNLIKSNEDDIIKLMINVDGVEIKKNSVLDQIKEIEPEYKSVTEGRLKSKEEFTKRIEELKAERKRFKNFENKSLLGTYQRLQREREGVAIAKIEEGVCSGCNVEVSLSTQQKLDYGDGLVYCQRCGRILFVPTGK